MQKRKLILAVLAVSSIGAIPFTASADFGVFVNEAPPAPRHEAVPHARRGYVWAPGYWDNRRGKFVWVQGHWEKEHAGMAWQPHRWEQRDGKWALQKGGWNQAGDSNRNDRDHDGVPNRVDRAPDNPRRQ